MGFELTLRLEQQAAEAARVLLLQDLHMDTDRAMDPDLVINNALLPALAKATAAHHTEAHSVSPPESPFQGIFVTATPLLVAMVPDHEQDSLLGTSCIMRAGWNCVRGREDQPIRAAKLWRSLGLPYVQEPLKIPPRERDLAQLQARRIREDPDFRFHTEADFERVQNNPIIDPTVILDVLLYNETLGNGDFFLETSLRLGIRERLLKGYDFPSMDRERLVSERKVRDLQYWARNETFCQHSRHEDRLVRASRMMRQDQENNPDVAHELKDYITVTSISGLGSVIVTDDGEEPQIDDAESDVADELLEFDEHYEFIDCDDEKFCFEKAEDRNDNEQAEKSPMQSCMEARSRMEAWMDKIPDGTKKLDDIRIDDYEQEFAIKLIETDDLEMANGSAMRGEVLARARYRLACHKTEKSPITAQEALEILTNPPKPKLRAEDGGRPQWMIDSGLDPDSCAMLPEQSSIQEDIDANLGEEDMQPSADALKPDLAEAESPSEKQQSLPPGGASRFDQILEESTKHPQETYFTHATFAAHEIQRPVAMRSRYLLRTILLKDPEERGSYNAGQAEQAPIDREHFEFYGSRGLDLPLDLHAGHLSNGKPTWPQWLAAVANSRPSHVDTYSNAGIDTQAQDAFASLRANAIIHPLTFRTQGDEVPHEVTCENEDAELNPPAAVAKFDPTTWLEPIRRTHQQRKATHYVPGNSGFDDEHPMRSDYVKRMADFGRDHELRERQWEEQRQRELHAFCQRLRACQRKLRGEQSAHTTRLLRLAHDQRRQRLDQERSVQQHSITMWHHHTQMRYNARYAANVQITDVHSMWNWEIAVVDFESVLKLGYEEDE